MNRRRLLSVVGASMLPVAGCSSLRTNSPGAGGSSPTDATGSLNLTQHSCDGTPVRPQPSKNSNLSPKQYPTYPDPLTEATVITYATDFEEAFAWNRLLIENNQSLSGIQIIQQGDAEFSTDGDKAEITFDIQATYRYESDEGETVHGDRKYRVTYRIWANTVARAEGHDEFRTVYCSE